MTRICAEPGCPEPTTRTRCDDHAKAIKRDQARQRRRAGDPSMTVYTTATWRATRARQLRLEPTCRLCGETATTVDHVTPRKVLVEREVENPDDPAWLQSLCASCHNRKTATSDGGFGRGGRVPPGV